MTLIPEGKYLANVVGAAFGTSSKGNHQVAVQFVIAPDDPDFAGESIAYVGTFTEDATQYTVEALRGTGWDGDDLEELKMLADTGQLGPAQIVVQHEEYEGAARARIRFVNRPGAGRFKFKEEMAPQSLKSFAASMKATLRSHARPAPRPGSAKPSASATRQSQPDRGTDGVPPPSDRDYRPSRGRGAPIDDDLPF